MLPVWLIVMGAVVQFGMLIGNRQQVALASRVGAEEASRTAGLPSTGEVSANIVGVVKHQLQSSGITQYKITLEYNLAGGTPITLSTCTLTPTGICNSPALESPDPWPSGKYVRVTVHVPATELTPNILTFFGFDISERYIRNATTFRHEL